VLLDSEPLNKALDTLHLRNQSTRISIVAHVFLHTTLYTLSISIVSVLLATKYQSAELFPARHHIVKFLA